MYFFLIRIVMYGFIETTKETIDYNRIEKGECLELLEPLFIDRKSTITDENVYRELEVFEDHSGDTSNSVFHKINMTQTYFGEMFLKNKLLNPVVSYNREPIKDMVGVPEFLSYIREKQKCLISFLKSVNPIYDSIFIHRNILDILKQKDIQDSTQYIYNCFNLFLPMYNILSLPIVLVLMAILRKFLPGYVIDKFRYFVNISFMGLMNLNIFRIESVLGLVKILLYIGFFIYNIYSSIKFSVLTYILTKKISEKLDIVRTIIKKTHDIFKRNSYGCKEILFSDLPCKHSGEEMGVYSRLFRSDVIQSYIRFIGVVDYHYTRDILTRNGYTIPSYIKSKKPVIIVREMGNPALDNSVRNNISIHNNLIITGPNACGKSTFIKGVVLNLLMAQTIGLCCSDYMLFTPFSYIGTQLYSTDEKGKLSLFQKQIKRMDDYIEKIKTTNGFSFSAVDEMFNATNYKDSEKISDIYCDKLVGSKGITIITTHLDNITRRRPGITNYRMLVTKKQRGIDYTYKIEEGVNRESVLSYLI
jgi:hypothetical protein